MTSGDGQSDWLQNNDVGQVVDGFLGLTATQAGFRARTQGQIDGARREGYRIGTERGAVDIFDLFGGRQTAYDHGRIEGERRSARNEGFSYGLGFNRSHSNPPSRYHYIEQPWQTPRNHGPHRVNGVTQQDVDQQYANDQQFVRHSIPVGRRIFNVIQPEGGRLEINTISKNLSIINQHSDRSSTTEINAAFAAGLHPDALLVINGQEKQLEAWVLENTDKDHRATVAQAFYEARLTKQAAYAAQQQAESQRGTAHTTYKYDPKNAPFTEFAKLAFADEVTFKDDKNLSDEQRNAARISAMEQMLRQVNKNNAEEFYQHLNTYIQQNPGEVAGKIGPLLRMQSQATPGTDAGNSAQASTLNIGGHLLRISELKPEPEGAREFQKIVENDPDLKEAANNAAAHYARRPPLADLQQVEFEDSDAGKALKARYENALAQQKNWDDMAKGNPIAGLFMMLLRPLLESMTPDSNPMAILEEAEEAEVHISAPAAVTKKLQDAGIKTITVRGAAPAAPEAAPAPAPAPAPAATPAPAAPAPAPATPTQVIAPDSLLTGLEIQKFEEAINTVLPNNINTLLPINRPLEVNGAITQDEMNIIRSLTDDQLAKLSDDAKEAVKAIKDNKVLTEIKHGATVDFDSTSNIPRLIQQVAQESVKR